MKTTPVLSGSEAREMLNRKGISVAKFARENNLQPRLVCAVLAGRIKGRIGVSHRAAVLLGMKIGELPNG
jgi:gp16 family phage-associated protein